MEGLKQCLIIIKGFSYTKSAPKIAVEYVTAYYSKTSSAHVFLLKSYLIVASRSTYTQIIIPIIMQRVENRGMEGDSKCCFYFLPEKSEIQGDLSETT